MNYGQTEQFREIYEQTYNWAEYTAKRYLTDEQDVQDVLQDSYVKAFTKLDTLQDLSKKQSWINMIVANTAMDYLKKKRPSVFSDLTSEDEDNEPLEFEDESTEFQVEPNIDRKETARIVNEVLEQLDQKYRLVLFQKYGQELKISEIAELNGCSENTVKTRLSRAEKQLKAKKDEFRKRGIDLAAIPVALLLKMAFFPETSYAAPNETVFRNCIAEAEKAAEFKSAGNVGGTTASAAKAAGATAAAAKTAGAGAAVKIIAAILAIGAIAGGAALADRRSTEKPENSIEAVTAESAAAETKLQTAPEGTIPAETEPESEAALFSEEEVALLSDICKLMDAEPETISKAYKENRDQLKDIYEKIGVLAWMEQAEDNSGTGKGLLLDSDHGMYLGDLKQGMRDGTGTLVWENEKSRFATGEWMNGLLNGLVRMGRDTSNGWNYIEGAAVNGNLDGEVVFKRCSNVWDGHETFIINVNKGEVLLDERWEFNEETGKYLTYSLEHPKTEEKNFRVCFFSSEDPKTLTIFKIDY